MKTQLIIIMMINVSMGNGNYLAGTVDNISYNICTSGK